MAHARKKRKTQVAGQPTNKPSLNSVTTTSTGARIPKSMVIRMGANEVGPSVSQLTLDTRAIMEPHTASRLKERRSNKLRDFSTMAGPLGVSHLLVFSRAKESGNVNLRLAITPRGPTFAWRVEKYSLARDIAKAQRRPKHGGQEHHTPPLLVMNNFTTASATAESKIPKHLEGLITSTFQSLFPPISPQDTPLSSIRRVLLLNRETEKAEDGTYVVSLRHYAITTRTLQRNLSRGVKRLQRAEKKSKPKHPSNGDLPTKRNKGALPDLSKLDDVADYLLDPGAGGYTSASESEVETDAEVEVLEAASRKPMNRKERARFLAAREAAKDDDEDSDSDQETKQALPPPPTTKKAIKLTEIGPRMRLRLVKVEEGLCEGRIMWHEFVEKTKEEERAMDVKWDEKKRLKEERRRQQKENLEAKKKKKGTTNEPDDDEEGDFDDDEWIDDGEGDEEEEDVEMEE